MTVPQVRLRPATPADEPLLFEIYAASRADELAQVPWSDEQRRAFLTHQHHAQRASYRTTFPDASYLVIEHTDGRPLGRLYRVLQAGELHVIDIALLPEWRGRGIGTALLRDVLAEADREHLDVTLYVERFNPAWRLYRRLGFVEVEPGDVYVLLRRAPGTPEVS